jgi:glycosyltransferase involved in cell wall biosynthesis
MTALVSVVIPAYNAAQYIRQTIESVCAQTHRSTEVIVIDDGSRDETPAIVNEWASRDQRVRLRRQDNAGVGAARNAGIREAEGAYIAPIDADDVWHPRKLEMQVACMEAHGPTTGLVYCWTNMIDSDGFFLRHGVSNDITGHVLPALIKDNFINCASVPLLRASALREVGNYLSREEQDGAQGCEDWDLSMRIAERYEVHLAPAYLVGYRQSHGMSFGAREMMDSWKFIQRRARLRNKHAAPSFFRHAGAAFYFWLGARAYVASHYGQCLLLMSWAARSDPGYLLDPSMYRLFIKSAARLIVGQRWQRHNHRSPGTTNSISGMFPPFSPAGTSPAFSESFFSKLRARRPESVFGRRRN